MLGCCGNYSKIELFEPSVGEHLSALVVRMKGQPLVKSSFSGKLMLALGLTSRPHSIDLFDPLGGTLVATCMGHVAAVQSLASTDLPLTISQRGLIASGSLDKTIRLWSRESTQSEESEDESVRSNSIGILRGHAKSVWSLSFVRTHPEWLISGSDDRTLRLWDLAKSAVVPDGVVEHPGAIKCVRSGEYGTESIILSCGHAPLTLLAPGDQGGFQVVRKFIMRYDGDVNFVVLQHPENENYVFAGAQGGKIRKWDLRNETEPVLVAQAHSSATNVCVRSIVHVGRGKFASCCSGSDHRIRVWSEDLAEFGPEMVSSGSNYSLCSLVDLPPMVHPYEVAVPSEAHSRVLTRDLWLACQGLKEDLTVHGKALEGHLEGTLGGDLPSRPLRQIAGEVSGLSGRMFGVEKRLEKLESSVASVLTSIESLKEMARRDKEADSEG